MSRLWGPTCLLLGLAALGRSEPGISGGEFLAIEVRVYNYVSHSEKIAQRARSETDAFFEDVGLKIQWVDCPSRSEDIDRYPNCTPNISPLTLIVHLLPGEATTPKGKRKLGHALVGNHIVFPRIASIFYGSVEGLAFSRGIGSGDAVRMMAHSRFMSVVVGRVMAHEISHLLGAKLHGGGLMEARLTPASIRAALAKRCQLSSGDAKRVRADVARRADAAAGEVQAGG